MMKCKKFFFSLTGTFLLSIQVAFATEELKTPLCFIVPLKNGHYSLEISSPQNFFEKGKSDSLFSFKAIDEALNLFDYYLEKKKCISPHQFYLSDNGKNEDIVRKKYSCLFQNCAYLEDEYWKKTDYFLSTFANWKISDFFFMGLHDKLRLCKRLLSSEYQGSDKFKAKMLSHLILSSGQKTLLDLSHLIKEFLDKEKFPQVFELLNHYLVFDQIYRENRFLNIREQDKSIVSPYSVEEFGYSEVCNKYYRNELGELKTLSWPWDYRWSFEFKACLYNEQNSLSKKVLYYFPSFAHGAKTWKEFEHLRAIRDEWRLDKKEIPAVFSITQGRSQFFQEKNFYKKFEKEIIPLVESWLDFAPEERYAMGISMGAGNVFHAFLKTPALFKKVVMVCPTLWTQKTFSDTQDIQQYITQNAANKTVLRLAPTFSKKLKNSDDEAFSATSPLVLAENFLGETSPAVYLSMGEDTLDKNSGGKSFNLLDRVGHKQNHLDILGGKNSFAMIQSGEQCYLKPQEISRFLIPPIHDRFLD